MSSDRVIRLIDSIKFLDKEIQKNFANDQYMSHSEFLLWLETELKDYVPLVDYQDDFEDRAIGWLKESFNYLDPEYQEEIKKIVNGTSE